MTLRGCLAMLFVHSFEYLLPLVFLGGREQSKLAPLYESLYAFEL